MTSSRRAGVLLCLSLIVAFAASPLEAQRGALVVPQNLAELVDQADTIIVGRVVSARAEKHPQFENLNTVVVTLQVEDVWKGSADRTLTFRQYIWDIRDVYSVLGYRKGGAFLLLLLNPNENGLSSTAGLEYGRFRILRDARGARAALNGFGNVGLFRGISAQLRQKGIELSAGPAALVARHQRGPIAVEELKVIVQQLAGEN